MRLKKKTTTWFSRQPSCFSPQALTSKSLGELLPDDSQEKLVMKANSVSLEKKQIKEY